MPPRPDTEPPPCTCPPRAASSVGERAHAGHRLALGLLLTSCWTLVGCTSGTEGSRGFSIDIASQPRHVGTSYRFQLRRLRNGAIVESWVEQTRLLRQDGDLSVYEHRTQVHGLPTTERLYVVERDQSLYMQEGGTEPRLVASNPPTHQLDAEMLLLKFPLRPQQYWEYNDPKEGTCSREVTVRQRTTVPAGTFEAVVINEQHPHATGRSWFVPGIGVVRTQLRSTDGEIIKELLAFEAPASKK